jgi:hypothetical protein
VALSAQEYRKNKGLGMCGERVKRTSATIGLRPFLAFSRVADEVWYQAGTDWLAPSERNFSYPDTASKD